MRALEIIKKTMQSEQKPTLAQQAKGTSSSENSAPAVKPTLNPVVNVNQNKVQQQAPAQAQVPQAPASDSWLDLISAEPAVDPEQQAKAEKRQKAIHRVASIGDAIASVANLTAATQGAQSANTVNLTDAARARYDKAQALREKNLALKQANWQQKLNAISDRAKMLQEQETMQREQEYKNKQYAADLTKQEEVKRANMEQENFNKRKLEQDDRRIAQDDKTIAAAIKRTEADAYEARARGDSYKNSDSKAQDFVVGNEIMKVPVNLFGNNTVGRNNLYSIFNEVVPEEYKTQLQESNFKVDSNGIPLTDADKKRIYTTPSAEEMEYYISMYGDPAKMKAALSRITGATPTPEAPNKIEKPYQTTKSGGLKLE